MHRLKVLTRQKPGIIAECCLKLLELYEIERGENDVLLSLQYDRYIKTDELSKYNVALNLHNAKLPEYGGFNTLHWELHNQEETHTSTLHWITEKIDGGPIAYQKSISIQKDDTVKMVYARSVASCMSIVEMFLYDLKTGAPIPKTQQTGTRHYYKKDELPQ